MTKDGNGNLWIASEYTRRPVLTKYDGTNWLKFDPINSDLPSTDLYSLAADAEGNVWIGTRDKGMLRYNRRKPLRSVVSRTADQEGLTAGWAFDIIESKDGNVWIVTEHGDGYTGLNVLDPTSNSLRNYPVNELHPDIDEIEAFFEETPGVFLIAANSTYYKFDVKANTFLGTEIRGVPDSVGIKRMYLDSKENMWICSSEGLYLRYANSDMFGRIEFRKHNYDSLKVLAAKRVYKSETHGLWVLTNEGLYLYDYALKNFTRHGNDQDSTDVFITQSFNSISVDSEGTVWLGLWGGGLCRYDVTSGQILTYTMDDGLPSNNIQGLLEDVEGRALWMSTFDGISRMNLETEQFTNFSIEDGLQGKMFGPGAYLKTSDGLFVF